MASNSQPHVIRHPPRTCRRRGVLFRYHPCSVCRRRAPVPRRGGTVRRCGIGAHCLDTTDNDVTPEATAVKSDVMVCEFANERYWRRA